MSQSSVLCRRLALVGAMVLASGLAAWLALAQAAKLRDNFGIPNKSKNPAETRVEWDKDVPAWIKAASGLGVRLD